MNLDELKQRLVTMACHAEKAVNEAINALIERDYDLALQVKDSDAVIDRLEVEIDDMAIHLLARAPLASDLRMVTVAMKISQNLERVGDEASKIAKRARDLSQEPPVNLNLDLLRLATLALDMLKQALDSFVSGDSTAARDIIPRDREVDRVTKQMTELITRHMIEHPDTIRRCLHLIVVCRSLERIADHATNVAEEAVYVYEARDIRHSGAKDVLVKRIA